MHDCCHGQLLGTGRASNGSVLCYLIERGWFGAFPQRGEYQNNMVPLLRAAYANFNIWKKAEKLQCSQPRFTVARLNRRLRSTYPSLNAKAGASKILSFWLAHQATGQANATDSTSLDRKVAVCAWAYARALQILDISPLIMTNDQKTEFHNMVMLHLRTYAALRLHSSKTKGKELNRCNWQLLPKHHHFAHCAEDTLTEGVNPKIYTLLAAESWIGIMGRISKRCHRSSVAKRTLERYLTCLFFAIKRLKAKALARGQA